MEYCGEVCSLTEFGERKRRYEQERRRHYYFMSLSADEIIDATKMGNYSRFINHSCEPNAETQKWNVCGQIRVGFFAVTDIAKNQEVTFDYQYERFTSSKMQKCFCGSKNCRGYLGAPKDGKPDTTRKPKTNVKKKVTPVLNEMILIEDQPANTIVYINSTPIKSDATTSNGAQTKPEVAEISLKTPNKEQSSRTTRNTPKNGETEQCTSSNAPPEPVKSEEQIFEEKVAKILGKEGELCTEKQVISLITLMQKTLNNFHFRQQLLKILHKSDRSMLKKFVANHGMQVLCTWMLQAPKNALGFRDACLKVLANVQISYRIIQEQPKLVNIIEQWAKPAQDSSENLVSTTTGGNSTSPESITQNSNSSNNAIEDCQEVEKFQGVTTQQVEKEATKIWEKWRSVCSVYTVPKREKISQPEDPKCDEKAAVTEKESKREESKKRARSRSKEKDHEHSREVEKSKETEKISEKSRHRERREERDKNRHHSSTSSYTGKSEKKHKSHHHHSSKDKHNRSKGHHSKSSKKIFTRNESNASEISNTGMRTTPISSPHSVTSEEKDVTPCTPTIKLLSKVIKKEPSLVPSKPNYLHIPKKPHPIVTQDPITSKPEMEMNNSFDSETFLTNEQKQTHNVQQKRAQNLDEKSDYKRPKKPRKHSQTFSNFKHENSDFFPNPHPIIPPTEEFFAPDNSYYYKFNDPYATTIHPPIGYPIPVQTVSVNTSLQLPPTVLSAKSDKLSLLTATKPEFIPATLDKEPPPPGIAPPLPPTQPTEIAPPPPPPLPQELSAVLNDPNLASAFAKSITEQPLLTLSNPDPAKSITNRQPLLTTHLPQANSIEINKSNELVQAFQMIQRHIPPDNVTQQILLAVLMQSMLPKTQTSFTSPISLPTITDNTTLLSSLINSLNPIQAQQNLIPNHLQEFNALTTTLFNSQPSPIENPLSFLTNPVLSRVLSQQKQYQFQTQQTIPTHITKDSDPPPPPPPVELPPNWKEATDSNGKPYYYNAMTRETQWERPVETNAFYQSPIRQVSHVNIIENYSPATPTLRNHRPLVPGTDPITPNSEEVISPYELFDGKEKCFTESEMRRENFKQRVSRHVISLLGEYRKPECKYGRISATEDFKYLARKLTYAIIEKETNRKGLDYELLFNESVKIKANEFVRSYMKKFGSHFKRACITSTNST